METQSIRSPSATPTFSLRATLVAAIVALFCIYPQSVQGTALLVPDPFSISEVVVVTYVEGEQTHVIRYFQWEYLTWDYIAHTSRDIWGAVAYQLHSALIETGKILKEITALFTNGKLEKLVSTPTLQKKDTTSHLFIVRVVFLPSLLPSFPVWFKFSVFLFLIVFLFPQVPISEFLHAADRGPAVGVARKLHQ